METGKIAQLLSQTKSIVEKYDKIAEATGERFNIFEITGLETDEVKLHSAFIAELLNPKGSHGLKDRFLKLFLEAIFKEKQYQNPEHAQVYVEKYIGPSDKDCFKGGRIDILTEFDDGKMIAIENKIYAIDQKHQLRRYANYSKDIDLIYLTLDGRKADNHSTCNDIEGFREIKPICISYKTDIVGWLEKCLKESTSHPLVRETIAQYIYLLKRLTDQNNNTPMENEIVNIIINNNLVTEAKTIYESWPAIRAKLLTDLFSRVKEQINTGSSPIKMRIEEKDSTLNIMFSKPGWDYYIYYFFEKNGTSWIGAYHNKEEVNNDKKKKINDYLFSFFGDKKSYLEDGWYCTLFKYSTNSQWNDIHERKWDKEIVDQLNDIIKELDK